jgi:hypothetical protein
MVQPNHKEIKLIYEYVEYFPCYRLRGGCVGGTEYTEYWPCLLFDILLNKYFPAG